MLKTRPPHPAAFRQPRDTWRAPDSRGTVGKTGFRQCLQGFFRLPTDPITTLFTVSVGARFGRGRTRFLRRLIAIREFSTFACASPSDGDCRLKVALTRKRAPRR